MQLDPDMYRTILEEMPAAVYLVDRDRKIVLWNRGAETITGYLRQEVLGHSCFDNLLMHCDEANNLMCGTSCPLAHTMHDGKPRAANVYLRHKDGYRVPVHVQAVPIRDEAGCIVGAVECFDERVAPVECGSQSGADVSVDSATGVPDRSATLARLQRALESMQASNVPFGVLNIHVDGLEQMRRMYGRLAVERVLCGVAQTLAVSLHSGDWLGRWSEDRFLVLAADVGPPGLDPMAARLKGLADRTGVPWWGGRISAPVSIGAAMALTEDTPESLAARAEQTPCGIQPADGELIGIA